ncbi:MAG: Ldh family oxidoreductase [Pseudomonadota bacterium]
MTSSSATPLLPYRFAPAALGVFARAVLATTGAPREKVHAIADVLLEGELLGYQTHGLKRLAYNFQLLQERAADHLEFDHSVQDRPVFSWDAAFQPGPWVITEALDHSAALAKRFGTSLGVIKRSGHTACAAAYMPKMLERGLITLLMASTPNERVICAPAGTTPVTSSTPLAFAAPSASSPMLFDFTLGAVTLGAIEQAAYDRRVLLDKALRCADGALTDDPNAINQTPPASILPLGGPFGMHKGFALALMVEVLTAGLTGLLPEEATGDGESNSVSIIVIDPDKFAGVGAVQKAVDILEGYMNQDAGARMPGSRAWQARLGAHKDGVPITRQTFDILTSLSQSTGIALPDNLP